MKLVTPLLILCFSCLYSSSTIWNAFSFDRKHGRHIEYETLEPRLSRAWKLKFYSLS